MAFTRSGEVLLLLVLLVLLLLPLLLLVLLLPAVKVKTCSKGSGAKRCAREREGLWLTPGLPRLPVPLLLCMRASTAVPLDCG